MLRYTLHRPTRGVGKKAVASASAANGYWVFGVAGLQVLAVVMWKGGGGKVCVECGCGRRVADWESVGGCLDG